MRIIPLPVGAIEIDSVRIAHFPHKDCSPSARYTRTISLFSALHMLVDIWCGVDPSQQPQINLLPSARLKAIFTAPHAGRANRTIDHLPGISHLSVVAYKNSHLSGTLHRPKKRLTPQPTHPLKVTFTHQLTTQLTWLSFNSSINHWLDSIHAKCSRARSVTWILLSSH